MTGPVTADPSYFKRGARIKPQLRKALDEQVTPLSAPTSTQSEARTLALGNLNKPWARRYMRSYGRLW